MSRLITALLISLALLAPVGAAEICLSTSAEEEVALAALVAKANADPQWKEKPFADGSAYATFHFRTVLSSYVKMIAAEREATMIQAARDCLTAGKSFMASVDAQGTAQGICK